MGMAIGPVLGLGSAILLNDKLRLRALFRTSFFLPTMTSLIVVATIWKFMYADNGIINAIAGLFGLPGHPWLTDPTTALPAVVVTAIWQGFGFETVVFLAALQAIPTEYYEAATVDGAGRWAKFRWVTLPGLRPTIVFVYVIGIIGSFQTFDQVFVMTNGGPIQATRTIVFDLVDRFNRLDIGGASAVAYILLVVPGRPQLRPAPAGRVARLMAAVGARHRGRIGKSAFLLAASAPDDRAVRLGAVDVVQAARRRLRLPAAVPARSGHARELPDRDHEDPVPALPAQQHDRDRDDRDPQRDLRDRGGVRLRQAPVPRSRRDLLPAPADPDGPVPGQPRSRSTR